MINIFVKSFSYLKKPSAYFPLLVFTLIQTVVSIFLLTSGVLEEFFYLQFDLLISNPLTLLAINPLIFLALILSYWIYLASLFWLSIVYSQIDKKNFISEIFSFRNFKKALLASLAVILILTALISLVFLAMFILLKISIYLALLFLFIAAIFAIYYLIRFLFFPFIMGKDNLNFYEAMMKSQAFTKGKFWNILFFFLLLQIILSFINIIYTLIINILSPASALSFWFGVFIVFFVTAYNQLAIYCYYKLKS